ncbi:MAG: hypothetical protein KC933_29625 [Myxococcales bacterium]|nr:hypothetical protein [Myxococcales bacterium]
MFPKRLITVLAAGALLSGCLASENLNPTGTPDSGVSGDGDSGVANGDGGTVDNDGGTTGPAFAKSSKAVLRFKRTTRLRNDISQVLGIPEGEICNELGQYSCTDYVHTISLGGVEAYTLGINEPTADTTVTTPIATERVVLSACERRARDDMAAPDGALIFKGLVVTDGKLDVGSAEVAQSIDTLYKRALLRAPTSAEVSHLTQLYRDIEADQQPNPARDWAILTCFSVLTSMESLFY